MARGGNARFKSLLPDIPQRTMTAEIARRLWSYDPELGILRWNISPHPRVKAGDVVGYAPDDSYRQINFKGRMYRGTHIIWLLMTGSFPAKEIDHRNGKPSDDRWSNLREANRTQQLANTRTRRDNALGVKGVHRRPYGSFIATICKDGKREHLGSFGSVQEAAAAYDAASLRLFGEFRRDPTDDYRESIQDEIGFWCEPWGWPYELDIPMNVGG